MVPSHISDANFLKWPDDHKHLIHPVIYVSVKQEIINLVPSLMSTFYTIGNGQLGEECRFTMADFVS